MAEAVSSPRCDAVPLLCLSYVTIKAPRHFLTRDFLLKNSTNIDESIANHYKSGKYWQNRMDLVYYSYVDYIVRTVGRDAKTMIDVGTAQCPYLEWFDWIPTRVSFDIVEPYDSQTVTGIHGDFLNYQFQDAPYDIVTCLQVLEHVPNPQAFSRKLLEIGKTVIISVPYKWPKSAADDHIHDPVDEKKIRRWMGRDPSYFQIVQEPFRGKVGKRAIAIYDNDRKDGYGRNDFKDRVRRSRFPMP